MRVSEVALNVGGLFVLSQPTDMLPSTSVVLESVALEKSSPCQIGPHCQMI